LRPNLPGKSNRAGSVERKGKGKILIGVLEYWSNGVMLILDFGIWIAD
jgi:hypothetical protein